MVWSVVWSARAGDASAIAARTAAASTVKLRRSIRVLPAGFCYHHAVQRLVSYTSREQAWKTQRGSTGGQQGLERTFSETEGHSRSTSVRQRQHGPLSGLSRSG